MFTINMIVTVIDEFQQLNLFVFELLFYVIGDMSIKSIVKFVISLASLLKKIPIIFKMLYFYKILDLLLRKMRPFFSRKIFYLLWGLRPGLEPALFSRDHVTTMGSWCMYGSFSCKCSMLFFASQEIQKTQANNHTRNNCRVGRELKNFRLRL